MNSTDKKCVPLFLGAKMGVLNEKIKKVKFSEKQKAKNEKSLMFGTNVKHVLSILNTRGRK